MHLADNSAVLSQESVQMGGAPEVGAALLRVLQHGYTELNNAQSLSSVWGLPQITHFFFSRNRNVQNLGQEQEQDLHYQRELKMKTTQTSILPGRLPGYCSLVKEDNGKNLQTSISIYSNDWAFLLICSFVDRLVNIITIKIAKWIVKILNI